MVLLVSQSCPTLCDLMDGSPRGPSPWNSPGKNTGVGSHSLLQGIFPTQGSNLGLLHHRQMLYRLSHQGSQSESEVAQSSPTLCNPVDCSLPGSSVHGNSPGKNTGVGSHSLLLGIFPTQGSNLGLLHCRQTLHRLSYQGSLQQKDVPFSSLAL